MHELILSQGVSEDAERSSAGHSGERYSLCLLCELLQLSWQLNTNIYMLGGKA